MNWCEVNQSAVRWTQAVLSRGARAVRGARRSLTDIVGGATLEHHPRKLDREIFEDGPSAKIGSLENFRPYGTTAMVYEQG